MKKEVKLAPEPWGLHAEKKLLNIFTELGTLRTFCTVSFSRRRQQMKCWQREVWLVFVPLQFENIVHFSLQAELGRACPAVLIVHLYSSRCSTIETHKCGVSEEIYFSETPKTQYFWRHDFYTQDVKREPIKPSKWHRTGKLCENYAFNNPFPWL